MKLADHTPLDYLYFKYLGNDIHSIMISDGFSTNFRKPKKCKNPLNSIIQNIRFCLKHWTKFYWAEVAKTAKNIFLRNDVLLDIEV